MKNHPSHPLDTHLLRLILTPLKNTYRDSKSYKYSIYSPNLCFLWYLTHHLYWSWKIPFQKKCIFYHWTNSEQYLRINGLKMSFWKLFSCYRQIFWNYIYFDLCFHMIFGKSFKKVNIKNIKYIIHTYKFLTNI